MINASKLVEQISGMLYASFTHSHTFTMLTDGMFMRELHSI